MRWKWKMSGIPLAVAMALLFWACESAGSPLTDLSRSAVSHPHISLLLEEDFNGLDFHDIAHPPSSLSSSSSASSATFQQIDNMVDNHISQSLEDLFASFTQQEVLVESSGDGSGQQEVPNDLMPERPPPSISLMDDNWNFQELDIERGGWRDPRLLAARPSSPDQVQLMDADRYPEITDMRHQQEVNIVASTQSTAITMSALSSVKDVNTTKQNITGAPTTSPQRDTHSTTAHVVLNVEKPKGLSQWREASGEMEHSAETPLDGESQSADEVSNSQVTTTDVNMTMKAYIQSQQTMEVVTKTTQSNQTGQDVTNDMADVTETPSFRSDEFRGFIGPITQSGSSPRSCLFGWGLCGGTADLNGTTLDWDDLSRTLAFAWELHVFGCAGLFLVLMLGATWGITSAIALLRPYAIALPMSNALLLLAGGLRCVHFLIDPYGTRHIFSRPALSALYNLPLPLLLWAQAVLATVILRGRRLNLLPKAPEHPVKTGSVVALHCSLLLTADMLSQAVSPALPLMLQTFSVCWGLPLCLGLLLQTLNPPQMTRTPVPLWLAAKHVEDRTRQVFALSAALGALSYALLVHGVLWQYGLLGDWRRFSWGWWVAQFLARLVELTWSYSLLLLSSWVFWRPHGFNKRRDATSSGSGGSCGGRETMRSLEACWDGVLDNLPRRPNWSETGPDRHWAGLLPNNWAAQKRAHPDIDQDMIRNYEVATTSQGLRERDFSGTSSRSHSGSVSSISSIMHDRTATPPWLQGHRHDWSERDCILSLIEFDLCPPSPISLTPSIENALMHDDMCACGMFTPQPPSWTQGLEPYCAQAARATPPTTPTHIAYRWALDGCASPLETHCFGGSMHHTEALEAGTQDPQPMLLSFDQYQPMGSDGQYTTQPMELLDAQDFDLWEVDDQPCEPVGLNAAHHVQPNVSDSLHTQPIGSNADQSEPIKLDATDVPSMEPRDSQYSQPIGSNADQTQPISLDAHHSQPTKLDVDQSQPIRLDANHVPPMRSDSQHSQVMKLDGELSEPIRLHAHQSQPMKLDADQFQPMYLDGRQSQPSVSNPDQSQLAGLNTDQSQSTVLNVPNSQPAVTNADHSQPMSVSDIRFPLSAMDLKLPNEEQAQQVVPIIQVLTAEDDCWSMSSTDDNTDL